MNITIKAVHKRFGDFTALDGVDLDIASGELLALLGPSGSGKTTLLRAIAGLEPIDAGRILFDEIDATRLSVQQRRAGFVFQHYALFKHMNVLDNITFGLRMQARGTRPSPAEIARRGLELLDLVQLSGLAERYPTQLSGGQRQRVALARALAIGPRVLLLDEPFGALDAKVRADLRRWLRELHKETGYTTIFVTHDQEEALELADRIVIMNRGRLEQIGTVDQVYEHPATPFVFDFLGGTNVIPAELQGRRLLIGDAEIAVMQDSIHPSGPVDIYVRPGDLRVAPEQAAGVEIRLQSVQRTGPILRVIGRIEASQTVLSIELPHLHHDVSHFVAGAKLRLRLMQFSIYPRSREPRTSSSKATPVLIGRERARTRT